MEKSNQSFNLKIDRRVFGHAFIFVDFGVQEDSRVESVRLSPSPSSSSNLGSSLYALHPNAMVC